MSRLHKTIEYVNQHIDAHDFSGAGEALRAFTLDDLADWYLEASKFENSTQKTNVLYYVLERILKLWHPFMPFVTEAIWQSYHEDLLLVAQWPSVDGTYINESAESEFSFLREVITAIRNARSENKIPPAQKIKAAFGPHPQAAILEEHQILLKSLRTGLGDLSFNVTDKIPSAIFVSVKGLELQLETEVDLDIERARLESELKKISALAEALASRLDNKEFVDKAPKEIIANEKNKLAEYNSSLEKIKQRLSELS